MIISLKTMLIFSIALIVDTRRPKLRMDDVKPTRDYRPSKWIANSALDIWYGNASMVDVLTREFTDIVDKIALRSGKFMY